MSNKLTNILVGIGFLLISAQALACPCGCGAVNPQVMYPGESMKIALGITRNAGYRDLLDDGEQVRGGGPDIIDTMTIGIGKSITQDISVSIALPIQTNRDPAEGTNTALSDPSFSVRYTALPQSFTEPLVPQVQLFATYKPSIAKGIDESERFKQMDVFGNGYSEFVPGIDLWWGMEKAKFGLGQMYIIPIDRDRKVGGRTYKQNDGFALRTILQGAYNFPGIGYLIAGLEREDRNAKTRDGNKIDGTEKTLNNINLAGSYKVGFRKTLGLAWRRTAALFDSKNSTKADAVTFSYMQAF